MYRARALFLKFKIQKNRVSRIFFPKVLIFPSTLLLIYAIRALFLEENKIQKSRASIFFPKSPHFPIKNALFC